MEAFSDPSVTMVVFVCAAQMGKTEIILSVIGWRLDDRPQPVIYVAPTAKLAKSVMKDRITQLIRSTPSLRDALDRRRGFNTTEEKYLSRVRLGIGWAGSSVELMSHPSALVIIDERDAMSDAIKNAGDPVLLAQARTKNYTGGKTGVFSTPTVEGESAVWAWWEAGSRHRLYLRCLHCDDWFLPRSELLVWPKGATPEEAKIHARLVCDGCGGEHDDNERLIMESRYFAHALDDEGAEVRIDGPVINSIRSFHANGLASKFTPLGEIAFQLCSAYRSNDQMKIQTALNAYLGECYKIKGESPGWESVRDCRQDYDIPPARTQLITCGVDVQKDCLWYVIRAWAYPNATSWKLEHGQIIGDTKFDDVWLKLRNLLGKTFDGRAIDFTLIDSGFRPGQRFERPENVIYQFCRRTPRAFPAKGAEQLDRPYKSTKPDVKKSGKTARGSLRLWWHSNKHWKPWLYGKIAWPNEDPGGWFVPLDVDDDYCKQVVNEEMIELPSGKLAWRTTGNGENHLMDCEILAGVGAHIQGVMTLPAPQPEKKPKKKQPLGDPSLERASL